MAIAATSARVYKALGRCSLRRAVIAYAGLSVLFDLVPMLPDSSVRVYASRMVVWVLIQGVVVWRLARGSALAWTFGLLVDVLGVAIVLVAAGLDPVVISIAVLSLVQAGVLLAPPLRDAVWAPRATRTASG